MIWYTDILRIANNFVFDVIYSVLVSVLQYCTLVLVVLVVANTIITMCLIWMDAFATLPQ